MYVGPVLAALQDGLEPAAPEDLPGQVGGPGEVGGPGQVGGPGEAPVQTRGQRVTRTQTRIGFSPETQFSFKTSSLSHF